MKTRLLTIAGTLLCVAMSTPAMGKTVLKLGHVWPASEIHAQAADIFAKDVEAATQGEVTVQVFGGSKLGSDGDLIGGLKLGTVDIWVGGAGVLSAASDTAKIFTQHFMISNSDHFKSVYEGPLGKEIADGIEKESGYQVLAYWLRGARWLTTKKKVERPEDLAGMKIRVPDSPVFVSSWRALGAAPTPMNFGEVFTALQQGVIDGQENPLSLILNAKFSEVVKYLVRTEHVYEPIAVVMSTQGLQRVPEAYRQAVVDAANGAARNFAEREVSQGDEGYLEQLQAQGMTLVDVDKSVFRAKVATVVDQDFPTLKPLYQRIVELDGGSAK